MQSPEYIALVKRLTATAKRPDEEHNQFVLDLIRLHHKGVPENRSPEWKQLLEYLGDLRRAQVAERKEQPRKRVAELQHPKHPEPASVYEHQVEKVFQQARRRSRRRRKR